MHDMGADRHGKQQFSYALCSCRLMRRYEGLRLSSAPLHKHITHTLRTIHPNGIISLCTSNYVTQTQTLHSARVAYVTHVSRSSQMRSDCDGEGARAYTHAATEKLLN